MLIENVYASIMKKLIYFWKKETDPDKTNKFYATDNITDYTLQCKSLFLFFGGGGGGGASFFNQRCIKSTVKTYNV